MIKRKNGIIYIFMFLVVIFAVLIWRGYSSPSKTPSGKVVPINVADYPAGWHFVSVGSDNDWHANLVYTLQFESSQPYLSSFIDFVQYDNFPDAAKAYNDYRSRAFWSPNPSSNLDWAMPSDIIKTIKTANQSEIACILQSIQSGEVEICTFWAQYNNCLIKFTSQMDDKLMSHSDFENLITTIDNRQEDSNFCTG